MVQDTFLTVGEVADLLKVSPRQVYRLVKIGAVPKPYKIGGSSRWLFTQLMEKLTDG
jgi:excisionase family DNA binding protein